MMQQQPLRKAMSLMVAACLILFNHACDSSSEAGPGSLNKNKSELNFGEVGLNTQSDAQEVRLSGLKITKDLTAEVSGDFEMSINGGAYAQQQTITPDQANKVVDVKIRCNPSKLGELTGKLIVTGHIEKEVSVDLAAVGVAKLHKLTTFNNAHLAFGDGKSQVATGSFSFPSSQDKVEKITMFVKLRCPNGGCNAWDVFANIKVRHPETEEWMEIGRYITPYGVDNSQVEKGFPIDVTDFKAYLSGTVELRSFIEVWGGDGWLLTVDFEIVEGDPDFKYYNVATILDYSQHSGGIPYGESHSKDIDKCIDIPQNAENTSLRTIITGWGHATPTDSDGRPCAEWCFRTHHINIADQPLFAHEMKGIGCGNNRVQPQGGNWQPDRAGWCPGMEVPVRVDEFTTSMAGESFCYSYQLEEWTNDMQSTADNKHAYYSISSYVVVKSDTTIDAPMVE